MFKVGVDKQRTPSGKAPGGLRTPGLNWGIRRVTQGATPSRTPALAGSRILQGTPHAGLVASSLQHLPNALDAEYWICKADVEEGQGHFEAAAELYQEALRRDVRPATAITRAYSEFRARMYAEHPVASFGLEADDGALLDVGNRPPVPSTTPRKLAINGKPMRVATPAAKRAPASAQKPFQRPASQGM
ncbi:hypothetical protein WJX72_009948 [[Myrmecia] bisecta]|uniref:Uncharacterized protein n=1 Tax=[Myrmecia] bisecta TaxID=41462 RepID=A0AAW1Q2W6_9CHLO